MVAAALSTSCCPPVACHSRFNSSLAKSSTGFPNSQAALICVRLLRALIHHFVAEDTSHPEAREIYAELKNLTNKIKALGSDHKCEPHVNNFAICADTILAVNTAVNMQTAFGSSRGTASLSAVELGPKSYGHPSKNWRNQGSWCVFNLKLSSMLLR